MSVDRLKRDLLNKLINAQNRPGCIFATPQGERVYVSQRKRKSA